MNKIGCLLLITGLLVGWNCVGPEEPEDGLIEDLPAVVNTTEVFTFNLKGNNYFFEEEYTLSMKLDSNTVLTTSLIVTNWSGSDTSRIYMINASDTTYAWFQITGNLTYTATDSYQMIQNFIPVIFKSKEQIFLGLCSFHCLKINW